MVNDRLVDRCEAPSVAHAVILVLALPGGIVHTTNATALMKGVIPTLNVREVGQRLDIHGAKLLELEVLVDVELVLRWGGGVQNSQVSRVRRCCWKPELVRKRHVMVRLKLQVLHRLGEKLYNDTKCAVVCDGRRENSVECRMAITVIASTVHVTVQ
jgi:hypothetical protein